MKKTKTFIKASSALRTIAASITLATAASAVMVMPAQAQSKAQKSYHIESTKISDAVAKECGQRPLDAIIYVTFGFGNTNPSEAVVERYLNSEANFNYAKNRSKCWDKERFEAYVKTLAKELNTFTQNNTSK